MLLDVVTSVGPAGTIRPDSKEGRVFDRGEGEAEDCVAVHDDCMVATSAVLPEADVEPSKLAAAELVKRKDTERPDGEASQDEEAEYV